MRRVLAGLAIGAALAACRGGKGGPRPASCDDAAAAIAAGMVELRPDLESAEIDPAPEVAALCVDDAWPTETRRCYVAGAGDPRALRTCSDQLDVDQRLHARELQEALHRRASEAGDGDSATGIETCDRLLAVLVEMSHCDALPEHIKEVYAESVMSLREQWEALDDEPNRARARIAEECASHAEQLRYTLDGQGC